MGIPLINKLKAVISPHQLLLQFEQDDNKAGILKGDQKAALQFLINTLKHESAPGESSKRKREEETNQSIMSVYLDTMNIRERPQPTDNTKMWKFLKGRRSKWVKISQKQ